MFRSVVLKVTNAQPGRVEIPVDFYLFADISDFHETMPRTNVLGFMRPSLRRHEMVARQGSLGLDTQAVLFHEYVHYLLRNNSRSGLQPKWYDESLAETLAATDIDGDRVVIGGSIPNRIRSLGLMHVPLSEVLTAKHLMDWHPRRQAVFYAKSFALVNYLHLARIAGGEDRLSQLQQYLAQLNEGAEAIVAFEAAFGTTPGGMEREMGKFLAKPMRPVLQLPKQAFVFDAAYTRSALSPDDIAYSIAYLSQANPAYARGLLQRNPRAAEDAKTLAGVAVTYQWENKFAEGAAIARRAVVLSPDDPTVVQELADLLLVWCHSDTPPDTCPKLLEEAKALYERLLQLEPNRLEAMATYGALLVELANEKSALPHLERVAVDAPWHVGNLGNLGLARHATQDFVGAIDPLRRALAWGESAGPHAVKLQKALENAQHQLKSATSEPR